MQTDHEPERQAQSAHCLYTVTGSELILVNNKFGQNPLIGTD
jgi:hypothetical protein